MTYNLNLAGVFTKRDFLMTFRIFAISFVAATALLGAQVYAGSETAAPAPAAAPAETAAEPESSVSLDELLEIKETAEDELPGEGMQEGRAAPPATPKVLDGNGTKKSSRPRPASEIDDFGSGAPIDVIMVREEEDDYIDPDMKNMSKLMWQLGVLDLSDNIAIDNYLLINECELFLRFYNNDIEWEKIREATREHLNNSMTTFPTKFEILVPIKLDRYNPEKQYFELEESSKMINVRRLDVRMNHKREVCNEKGREIRGYPRNMILTLSRPFSFTRVPVGKALAELYIEEARLAYENMPLKLQPQLYERIAFMRAKVNITSFKEAISGRQGEMQAVVIAQLEGVEIYADVQQQKLMYREDKKPKSIRQRRKEQREGQPDVENYGAQSDKTTTTTQPKQESVNDKPLPKGITPFSKKNFQEDEPAPAANKGSAVSGGSASSVGNIIP